MASTAPPSSSSTTTPESSTTTPNAHTQKSFSCVLCAQRKVKCDKRSGGCMNCAKARIPCIYKAPPPPRRRRKGAREIDIHARLRLYEDALRELGIDPEELENKEAILRSKAVGGNLGATETDEALNGTIPAGPRRHQNSNDNKEAGVLISGDGKSRYLENGLWTSLKSEFRDSKLLLDESSDEGVEFDDTPSPEAFLPDGESLLFGTHKPATTLRPLHPRPVQIFKLWQTYLENINPVVKVFHTPTIQQVVLNASGNLDDIPKNAEALMFSIYCITAASLDDAECKAIMGDPKTLVMQRFRVGAQHALANAGFLKTNDLMTLQAYVLFLVSLQNFDARVLWIFSGVASRIGQRIGLHRDGEILGLPPFEIEMRRRLWWQIVFIEGSAGKLAGIGGNILLGDTKRPSNLNDSDLFQGMKDMPKEHEGPTEMMHFLIRARVGEFLKRTANKNSSYDGAWNKLSTATVALSVKEKAIDELDELIKRKFIQYCDPSVPWHFMCIYLAKSIIFMLRFVAHSADQETHPQMYLSQPATDMLFGISLQVVSYQNMAYTTKEMQGFVWHVNMHFQWKAFIYLISELRHRSYGSDVDKAWKQVQTSYEFYPDLAKETYRRALPIAVGNLTLSAWDVYVASRGVPAEGEPYFIQILRTQRAKAKLSTNTPQEPKPFAPQIPSELTSPVSIGEKLDFVAGGLAPTFDSTSSDQWTSDFTAALNAPMPMPELQSFDPDSMNWSTWDNLVTDFQINDAAFVDMSQYNFGTQ